MERVDRLVFCKLEGRFVDEHEAAMRTRDKKREKKERRIINKSRDRGRSDATRLVLSGSEGILTASRRTASSVPVSPIMELPWPLLKVPGDVMGLSCK